MYKLFTKNSTFVKDIYPNTHPLTIDVIHQNGYTVDWTNYFLCEFYTDKRFEEPKKTVKKY